MERLEAFENMLLEIQRRADYETAEMERLKAVGREKTATYRQYFANRLVYRQMLELYKEFGLIN